jgi:hypothetical protein
MTENELGRVHLRRLRAALLRETRAAVLPVEEVVDSIRADIPGGNKGIGVGSLRHGTMSEGVMGSGPGLVNLFVAGEAVSGGK